MKFKIWLVGAVAVLGCAASVGAQNIYSNSQRTQWNTPFGQSTTSSTVIQMGAMRLNRVHVTPQGILKQSDTLTVTATGTPGFKCTFTIDGITADQPMKTTMRIGEYVGTFTVTDKDTKIGAQAVVTMAGANGDKIVDTSDDAVTIDGTAPTLTDMAPTPNSQMHNRRPTITAVFDDGAGTGIDAKTVRFWVNEKDVTHSAKINEGQISYQPKTDFTEDTVKVHIRLADKARNVTDYNWQFSYAADTAK